MHWWYLPNPASNLDGLGRISEKWPDSGFAGAEIRYSPKKVRNYLKSHLGTKPV